MLRLCATFLLFSFAGLVVQAIFVKGVLPDLIAPDFILILVVYAGLRHRGVLGVVSAFLLGLVADFASEQFVGPNAAGMVCAFCLAGYIAEKMYAETLMARLFIVFTATMAKSAARLCLIALYVHADIFRWNTLSLLVGEALVTAAVSPLIFWLLQPRRSSAPAPQMARVASLRWSH